MENNKNIKVSIIVPTYNVEEYVIKALKSITNQTLKEIEIIIVDDASTDNTLSLVNSYLSSDSRIQVIKHNVNQGVGVARNSGIAKAQGEYIGFIDPDDYISEDYFKTLYDTAKKYDADLSCGQVIGVTNKEGISENQLRWCSMHESLLEKPIIETYLDKQYVIYNFVIWNKIYKRDFINKNNISFPDPNIGYEDTFFNFVSVALSNKIAINPNVYYYYYMFREGSLSTLAFKHFDVFVILQMSQNWLKKTKLLPKATKKQYQTILNTLIVNCLCTFNAGIIDNDDREEFLIKSKVFFKSIDLDDTINLSDAIKKNVSDMMKKQPYNITIKFLSLTFISIVFDSSTLNIIAFNIINLFKRTYSSQGTSYFIFRYLLIFRIKTNLNIQEYYLLGVKIYEVKTKLNIQKYYLLGVKIYEVKTKLNIQKYYLLGVKIYEVKTKLNIQKYYLLGLRIYKKTN